MKKTLLFICFLCSPSLLISQFHTSIDLIAGYDIKNEITYGFDVIRLDRSSRLNYRVGGNFNFRVFDQGYIKTGVRFARLVNKPVDFAIPEGSTFYTYFDEYYLEVPLMYRFEFSKKKFSLFSEFGVSPHFYLKGKRVTKTLYDVESLDYDIPYLKNTRVRLAFIIGVGFNYTFTKKMQLFMQPTYRFYPRVGTQTLPINGTTNYGVEFGIRHVLSFVNGRI